MLSAFNLAQRINESAAGNQGMGTIEAYAFIGTMAEATTEFNDMILGEAVNMSEFHTGAEEILAEAATTNPDSLDAINENVFTTIKEGVIKFFEKLKSMVKGIVEKLKAFFFKLTGKTDKWLTVMKPRIEAAKRNSGTGDLTMEMHKWDTAFITEGMLAGITKMMDTDLPAIKGVEAAAKAFVSAESIGAPATKANPVDADSDKTKAIVKQLEDYSDTLKSDREELKNDCAKDLASALGVSANSSMDAVYKDVAQKATGGEKVTVKFVSEIGVDKMVETVDKSKTTIDNLKKAYEKHLTKIHEDQKKVEAALAKVDVKNPEKYATEVVRAAKACLSNYSTNITAGYSTLESAVNTVRGMNVKYVQDMISEYMNALTKFAGSKSK